MSLLHVHLASYQKRQICLSLVKLWISLSGVEENLMKDKNTRVQHETGVLCTLCGTLVENRLILKYLN